MARRPSSLRPILCAVLDGEALGRDPHGLAAALFEAGVDWIQLRDRKCQAAELARIARALVAARDGARNGEAATAPRVIVNKRADVALAAGADGVHLGMDALDARSVERLFGAVRGPGALVLGASLHSIAELEAIVADAAPITYAQLAPIWSPRSKPAERPELGLEPLSQAARIAARAGIQLLAQGGLDAPRAAQAVAAGAAGIAVTGILSKARDPVNAALSLRRALDGAGGAQ